MSAKKQLEKEIREAYIFLREKNMTVPSETLQFMLDASLDRLNNIESGIVVDELNDSEPLPLYIDENGRKMY